MTWPVRIKATGYDWGYIMYSIMETRSKKIPKSFIDLKPN